jgi:hypothetical protein
MVNANAVGSCERDFALLPYAYGEFAVAAKGRGYGVSMDGNELLVFDPGSPVPGTASVVGDGEYEKVVTTVHVDEVVGKARNPCSSQGEICSGFRKRRAGLGPCGDHDSGSIDCRQERQAESWALLVIPTDGVFELGDGFWSKPNVKCQSAN